MLRSKQHLARKKKSQANFHVNLILTIYNKIWSLSKIKLNLAMKSND